MSDPATEKAPSQTGREKPPAPSPTTEVGPASHGPSLGLLYGLLALAFVLAIAFAALILHHSTTLR
jgi:hypothetical protein